MFPSHLQLTDVSERSQLRSNNKLIGNKEGEPDEDQSLSWSWWEAAQFSLPSKVIQVKPAATVSKPRSQPGEPDNTSTTPPKKASTMYEDSQFDSDDLFSATVIVRLVWSYKLVIV